MAKWILITILLASGLYPLAMERFTELFTTSKNGSALVKIFSHVDYTAYCRLYNEESTYFIDWYLKPYSESRWYYVPDGEWYWSCS